MMRRLPRFTLLAMALLCLAGCDLEKALRDGRDPLSERGDYTARAIDGDTFESSEGGRWRLARIDTPEFAGHCRPGRKCVEGNPEIAYAVLGQMLKDTPIKCKRITTDVYRRSIGECYTASGKNISNEMLRLGVAERYER